MNPDITGPDSDGLVEAPCGACGRIVVLDVRGNAGDAHAYFAGPRTGRPVRCNACFGMKLWSHPRNAEATQ